jgi:hypothetical protein
LNGRIARVYPGPEWRFFYEAADFVKTCWKIISFIFDPFWPPFGNNSPLGLWSLIIAAAFTPQCSNAKVSYSFERAT